MTKKRELFTMGRKTDNTTPQLDITRAVYRTQKQIKKSLQRHGYPTYILRISYVYPTYMLRSSFGKDTTKENNLLGIKKTYSIESESAMESPDKKQNKCSSG